MDELNPGDNIPHLLAELHRPEVERRRDAVEQIGRLEAINQAVITELKRTTARDDDPEVRQRAKAALAKFRQVRYLPRAPRWKERFEAGSAWEFWGGFVGWYLINGAFWLAIGGTGPEGIGIILNVLVLPANLLLMLILYFSRPRASVGIILALAVNLAIAIVLGSVYGAMCAIPFFVK